MLPWLWGELKVVLARLRDQRPGALRQYAELDVDEGRQPPFTIRLAPWATATAEELHQRAWSSARTSRSSSTKR